jgi:hypothetical protein
MNISQGLHLAIAWTVPLNEGKPPTWGRAHGCTRTKTFWIGCFPEVSSLRCLYLV